MLIIPDYDADALAAPQSFRNGIQIAIDILDAAFSANITVKIAVGYGEKDGIPLPSPNISKGGFSGGVTISYAALRSDLLAASDIDATSTSLPSGASVNGVSNFLVSPTQERIFGLLPAVNSTATDDGSIGMGTGFTANVLVSGALHEFTHALGRVDGTDTVLDIFRFTSPGSRLFTGGGTAVPAYFSMDDGATDIADFGQTSDPGDFLNPPGSNRTRNDPFNEDVGNLGGLTPIDREIMDALGFAVTNPPAVSNDFNDDQFSDVLWRNNSLGLADWSMTGGAITSSFLTSGGVAISPDASWNVVGIADFNGDKDADVLWRNTNGTLIDWSMNGSVIQSSGVLNQSGVAVRPDASWTVAGVGDFDKDGDSDVLWRNISGELTEWLMNGSTIIGSGDITSAGVAVKPDASWSIAGLGDFDGDGREDVLWRNTSGETAVWLMNGTAIAGSGDITSAGVAVAPDASWSVTGVGDFNSDGSSDVLWRNTSGELTEWRMNGSTIVSSGDITFNGVAVSPDATWNIVEIGDFNGDGRSDVLWRNTTTGGLAEWIMRASSIIQSLTPNVDGLAATPDGTWTTLARSTDLA